MERPQLEKRVREFFDEDAAGVVAVYLYGSFARGDRRPGSDVDVAVLLSEPEPTLEGTGLALEGELERRLGMPIDLVVLNAAPSDLVHRILRDGRLLVDRDPSLRVAFEVRARNEYFDLLPYLDEYRRIQPARA